MYPLHKKATVNRDLAEKENWGKIYFYFEGMWKMLYNCINEEEMGVRNEAFLGMEEL